MTKVLIKINLVILALFLVRAFNGSGLPAYAATAGGITNLQSANGLCDGGGDDGLGRCKQGSISNTFYAFACGADNGNDPTHCNSGMFQNNSTWNAMRNGSYYEIGRYVWPSPGGGTR